MAWVLWGMTYGLNALVYELWPGCFRGMSYGLDGSGYELSPECFMDELWSG